MIDDRNSFQWFVGQAFGSDELSPYTAEYAWNSNQMAHAMMGFALAVVWLLLVVTLCEVPGKGEKNDWLKAPVQRLRQSMPTIPRDVYVVILFALIPIKEVLDILLDRSRFATSPVSPNYWALYFDSLTDISFWWTGMFLAAFIVGLFVAGWARAVIPLVGLGLCIGFWYYYASPQWLSQKRTFDLSRMPFNYMRLAQMAAGKSADEMFHENSQVKWTDLAAFREEVVGAARPPQRHYVIVGGKPADRTNLAVSIGSEYAFKLRPGDKAQKPLELTRVYYSSAPAILERPAEFDDLLNPDVVECVVINHLDTVVALPRKASPEAGAEVLDQMKLPEPVAENLAEKFELPRNYSRMPKQAQDSVKKPPATSFGPQSESQRMRIEADIRRAKFEVLGELVKSRGISTVWVLSGDRSSEFWPANRTRWIKDIADLIAGGDLNALKVVELKD